MLPTGAENCDVASNAAVSYGSVPDTRTTLASVNTDKVLSVVALTAAGPPTMITRLNVDLES